MQLGMVGLGKMGGNMARRLQRAGHDVVALDLDVNKIAELEKEGMSGATNIQQFAAMLNKPRVAWLMVPAGDATEAMVNKLAEVFEAGDILIDGGNSYFKDDVRRAEALKDKGIHYADVGTSGGVWGLERGYCLMIGAENETFAHIEPILKTLAPGIGTIETTRGRSNDGKTAQDGYLHCGPVGAGHFVKMVHNGIEYGLMQAYGEGFDIMLNASSKQLPANIQYNLDLGEIAELWRRGSVVSSWLLDLSAIALAQDPKLESYTGYVQDSGEGRWTIMAAIEEAVPAEVLAAALYVRFRSRQEHTFTEKMLSAMRKQFGGHLETPAGHH
jgi:6-phosphogluconate dehydrogenase